MKPVHIHHLISEIFVLISSHLPLGLSDDLLLQLHNISYVTSLTAYRRANVRRKVQFTCVSIARLLAL
jgi:hypothetical protein